MSQENNLEQETKNPGSSMDLFREYQKTKVYNEEGKLVKSDKKMRNKLAEQNIKLVTYVVNKFYNKLEYRDIKEDLIQEGHIGLFTAIDKFNPEKGFKFSTYAVHWIQQACSGYLLESKPHLHIPSHVRTAQNKLLKYLKNNEKTLKDVDQKTMDDLGISDKMMTCINSALASKQIYYFSEPISSSLDSETTLGETIKSNVSPPEEQVELNGIVELAKQALLKLTERERLLILLRYNIIQTTQGE